MSFRSAIARQRPGLRVLVVAALLAGGGTASAGDEDLSPNAYQEFDPVTGFMVTVDPDADAGHDDEVAAQAEHGDAADAVEATADSEPASTGWLYWVIIGVAAAGVLTWLRRKAPTPGT